MTRRALSSRPYAVALEAVAQALAPKFWQRRRQGHVGLDDIAAAAAAADAARLCAELTTDEALHPALISARIPEHLDSAARALRGYLPARWWWPWGGGGGGKGGGGGGGGGGGAGGAGEISESVWRAAAECESARHVAAAWYALARSEAGRASIVAAGSLVPLQAWAEAKHDRIVHRYTVGALSRLVGAAVVDRSSDEEAQSVAVEPGGYRSPQHVMARH